MGAEKENTEFSLFGILDGKETCLATVRTLMEINTKYEMWKHATMEREYTYNSLEIRRVTRATIRTCVFRISVKEE